MCFKLTEICCHYMLTGFDFFQQVALIIFSSSGIAPPPFTGAGCNPSLCTGTAVVLSQLPNVDGKLVFKHHWVYWVGPIITSIVHAALYKFAPPHHEKLFSDKKDI